MNSKNTLKKNVGISFEASSNIFFIDKQVWDKNILS